ncbi:hypothetical protein AVEN_10991-1 [Araneus ventricosus]|uniref:F-box domain-containing protein n=1 Tax=Araneus ventricosus TaxID=182803 RepID=A0A4Y2VWP9_ARAVE|nr:hypothetical protein AVEN_220400-1 [Araneus ventricosus]GBO28217.1 hypothetical protein AVEN_10991-1 [Araneus ventricosus]
MSLVSRNWSEGFGLPPGCETFKFSLTKSQLSMHTCPVMEFVHKYSSMFLHVEIEYIHRSKEENLIKRWCWHFIEFLQILTSNSQLISVQFLNLSECFEHIDTATYANICGRIFLLLGSQHHLNRVEFRLCSFRFPEGVEILRKLTENSRESLTHLVLLEFISYEPMDNVILSFQDSLVISLSTAAQNQLPSLVDFPSLTTLEIDYSFIFVNMVARHSTAIQTVQLVLSKIILHYDNKIMPIDFRGLTSTDWRLLKTLCPDLQVEFIIHTDSPSRREVEFLIAPNMPITMLEYACETFDMEMETGVLFDHLLACKNSDNLVFLKLLWASPIPVSTLIPFLQACRNLKCLELSVQYSANGLDILMQSLLENRPESLQKVLIHILEFEDEDYENWMRLASQYMSRLELEGLNAKVDSGF